MTDFYVRPAGSGVHGAANGTSYADAWTSFANVLWDGAAGVEVNAGDTLYVCGQHNEYLLPGAAGTSGNPITIDGNYAPDPGSFDITGASVGHVIRLYQSWLTVQNLSLQTSDNSGVGDYAILSTQNGAVLDTVTVDGFLFGFGRSHSSGTTHANGPQLIDCIFDSQAQSGVYTAGSVDNSITQNIYLTRVTVTNATGAGVQITSGGTAAVGNKNTHVDGVYVDDCNFNNNGAAGFRLDTYPTESIDLTDIRRPRNVQVTNSQANNNGSVSFNFYHTLYDPGVIPRSRLANCTADNNSVTNTPGSMENIGCDGLLVEDNRFTNGHSDGTYDGVGMWIDLVYSATDPVVPTRCIYRRNRVENHTDFWNSTTNTSAYFWGLPPSDLVAPPSTGMRILAGTNNEINSNVFIGQNIGLAFSGHPANPPTKLPANNNVHNNTFINNHGAGVYYKYITNTSNDVANNIFVNYSVTETETYPVFSTESTTQQTLGKNLFYGFTEASSTVAAGVITTTGAADISASVAADPEVSEDTGVPHADSPVLEAGVQVSGAKRDKNNKCFGHPRAIGAYRRKK